MAALPGIPGQHGIKEAIQTYVEAVKSGSFPDNTQHAW
jgi:3-methyl-2-oxobutanoate hydroxymethyltransferase